MTTIDNTYIEHGYLALTNEEVKDFRSVLVALGELNLWNNPEAAVESFKTYLPNQEPNVIEVSIKRLVVR